MATHNDFNGVYFTLQSLRLYHDLTNTELIVVDNFGCDATKHYVESINARYILFTEVVGSTIPKGRLFLEAEGDAVLCCDSHVLFAPGSIARLRAYYRDHPDCIDFLQGPIVFDDLTTIRTHLEMKWNAQQWGVWQTDPRGLDPEGDPFEIPAQGLGAFSCRRAVWPGFNPRFHGFGGGEGYIHEKIRRAGGRCLCLPWLRWVHRFDRPAGIPYRRMQEDYLRNHVIGHAELGLDLTPMLTHFSARRDPEWVKAIVTKALRDDVGASLAIDFPG